MTTKPVAFTRHMFSSIPFCTSVCLQLVWKKIILLRSETITRPTVIHYSSLRRRPLFRKNKFLSLGSTFIMWCIIRDWIERRKCFFLLVTKCLFRNVKLFCFSLSITKNFCSNTSQRKTFFDIDNNKTLI